MLLLCLLTSNPLSAAGNSLLLASSDYYPHYAHDLPQQGAVSEIVRQAFLLQNIDITIEFMPFARAYRETKNARYAGLIGGWYDDARAEHFYYSQPMYANQIVFFKRQADDINYQSYEQLAQQQLRLGLVQGYLQPQGLLDSQPTSVSVAHDEQAFKMLALGRVDLVPADKLNGLYLINNKLPVQAQKLDFLMPALELRPIYLLLSKKQSGAEELIRQFNIGLAELRRTGQYQQILDTLLPTP
ncbi:substrate-binding periplasmic protein [Pseudoalteromonas mariniglutinosa]|uniref:substrate-binding periplasmic protein n=1 Tax=Pseudoalteromonas mariniglutinosa TaxID=206042 RepID=UPI00384F26C9